MKKGFVQTQNFKLLKEAEKLVARRGAREAGLVLVQGVYGIGKSELTERWASEHGHVFLRARETWTKRSLLEELASVMGLSVKGTTVDVQNRIIGHLSVSMQSIIIDEADHLVDTRSASKLETVRDITDLTGTMVFLVGMENLPAVVQRHEHIASRVARIVELKPLSVEDVQATCRAKADVRITPALQEQIHRDSKGRMRHVLNAIANIEHWAEANSWPEVDVSHVKGQALCADFSSHLIQRRRG